MYPEIFSAVVGETLASAPALLRGWRRQAIRHETYPAATPSASAQIEGVVWFNVSAQAVARLDLFETQAYIREQVQVETSPGQLCLAEIYLWLDLTQLIDEDWSTTEFETQHLKNFFQTHGKIL